LNSVKAVYVNDDADFIHKHHN